MKINKRGKRQQRVIGIDGYNIYNYSKPGKDNFDPTDNAKKKSSFVPGFISKKIFQVKRKQRPINSIVEVKKLDKRSFVITF